MAFEFVPTDWVWEKERDPARQERLRLVIVEIKRQAGEIAAPHGLKVEVPEGCFAVGVQGDSRTRTPVVFLIGPNPGWEEIAKVSNEITSRLPVNKVLLETARTTK